MRRIRSLSLSAQTLRYVQFAINGLHTAAHVQQHICLAAQDSSCDAHSLTGM